MLATGIFAGLPLTASAATPPGAGDVCAIGSTGYASLDDALAAVPDPTTAAGKTLTTIKLLADAGTTWGGTYIKGNVIIDMNGKAITGYGFIIGPDIAEDGTYDKTASNTVVVKGSLIDVEAIQVWGGSSVTFPSLKTGESSTAALSLNSNSIVTINGNVELTGDDTNIALNTGSHLTINGNVTDNNLSPENPAVRSTNSTVKISGNVISSGIGCRSIGTGSVTVSGNIQAGYAGAEPVMGSEESGGGAGVGGTIIVNGTITAPNYIAYWDGNAYVFKTSAQFTTPTTKPGYLTYKTDGGTVWVKAALDISKTSVKAIPDRTWTGGQFRPAAVVTASGYTLVPGLDYTVSYGANKNIGKGTVTITAKGKNSGSKAVTFKIVPKAVSITKATVGKNKVTLKWKKPTAAQKITGFSVQYKAKGASKWKVKTIKASKLTSAITKLKKGKQYQFRIRAYKKVSGSPYYSAWSKVVTSKKVK